MDGLLLLAAEALIIGISVWVVLTDTKTAEEISRLLDTPPKARKPRFADLTAPLPASPRRR